MDDPFDNVYLVQVILVICLHRGAFIILRVTNKEITKQKLTKRDHNKTTSTKTATSIKLAKPSNC